MQFDWLGIGTFSDRNETQGGESFFIRKKQKLKINNKKKI